MSRWFQTNNSIMRNTLKYECSHTHYKYKQLTLLPCPPATLWFVFWIVRFRGVPCTFHIRIRHLHTHKTRRRKAKETASFIHSFIHSLSFVVVPGARLHETASRTTTKTTTTTRDKSLRRHSNKNDSGSWIAILSSFFSARERFLRYLGR